MSATPILAFLVGLLFVAVLVLARQTRALHARDLHFRVLAQETKAFVFELQNTTEPRPAEERLLTTNILNNVKMLEMLAAHQL